MDPWTERRSERSAFVYSALERYVAAVLSFISMVVLSRLLSPAEVGTYVTGFAIASLVQSFRDFGTSSYLVQKEPTADEIRGAFGVAVLASALVAIFIYTSSGAIAKFYNNEALKDVLRLCAVLCVLQPVGLPARALLRRNLNFKALCCVNSVAAGTGIAASIYFALSGAGHVSAPLGAVATACMSIVLLWVHSPNHVFVRPSFDQWRQVASFGGYSTATSLLVDFGVQAPTFIVGRMLGFGEVAIYNRAQSLLRATSQIVVSPLLPAVLPTLSRAKRDGRDVVSVYLHLTSIYLSFVWPSFALLAIICEDAVGLLLGPEWTAVTLVAQTLCIGAMIWAPTALSGDLFIATGNMKPALAREMAIQPLRVMLVYCAAASGSLVLVAVSQIAVHAYSVVITQALLRRKVRISWRELARATWPSAGVLAITLALPLALEICEVKTDSALTNIIMVAIIGAISWIVAVFALRHPAAREVFGAIRYVRKLVSR